MRFFCVLGSLALSMGTTEVRVLAQPPRPGPEAVMIVANRKSDVSGRIARYYALKRGLAEDHICWIKIEAEETIDGDAFEFDIEKPVRKCLTSRGLAEKILYLVTTKGVPLRVGRDGAAMKTESASVDSELTLLYAKIHGANVSLVGPAKNPYFRQTQTPFSHPSFAMYLVTRLDAYDFDGVKGIIDHSLEAEQAANTSGKIYLDMVDGSDMEGESWLRDAAVLLPAGRSELEQTTTVVYGKKQALGYAGWGSNDHNHKERRLNFQWLPGALATEYVSNDGRTFVRPPATWKLGTWAEKGSYYANAPQSLTADFIEDGATGASGHVFEPYLQMTPHPDLLFPAYLGGRNLAEAFYSSIQALSWMNIFIGDPLCHVRLQ